MISVKDIKKLQETQNQNLPKLNKREIAGKIRQAFTNALKGSEYFDKALGSQIEEQIVEAVQCGQREAFLKLKMLPAHEDKLFPDYAYLYNGKDTDCFVACFNRAFGQVKKGYAEYRLRQDYLEFLTDSYWLSEREIFSVNTRLRSDNYCINRYLLNLIRSSLLDYVVGYIRKYGYQIKRIEVKLDGTFYFTVVW